MKTLLLVIASVFVFSTYANTNNNEESKSKKMFSISGKVMDANESLTGVKIILDGKETNVYTDFDGNFVINNVTEGEHTVSFSLVTYDNKELTFNTKEGNNLKVELNTK